MIFTKSSPWISERHVQNHCTLDFDVGLRGGRAAGSSRTGLDLIYSRLDIKPSMLKHGDNVVEVRSDTEQHGVEVMLPGPALFVRTK